MKEGDKINLGCKELEVIHTPGHTPDSVSLLERRERLLFTGDIFYPAPIYIYSKDSDIDEFISSFRKIVKANYDWAMPAHNEAMVEKGCRGHPHRYRGYQVGESWQLQAWCSQWHQGPPL
jgi:glyoxylase-like metal-dependent hydrolase (beta-lactamase superfamily II)